MIPGQTLMEAKLYAVMVAAEEHLFIQIGTADIAQRISTKPITVAIPRVQTKFQTAVAEDIVPSMINSTSKDS